MCTHTSTLGERRETGLLPDPAHVQGLDVQGQDLRTHTQAGFGAEESRRCGGPLSESPQPAPALLGMRGQGKCLWEPPLRWFEQNGPKRLVFECLLPCWWNCRGLGGAALLEEICHWSWVSRFQNTTIPVGSLSASNLQIGWKLSATTLRHGPQHDGHCLTL